MKTHARRRQGGYTFVEVLFVVAIGAAAVGMAGRLYRGASDLSESTRDRMDLAADLHASHMRVQATLRNASLGTVAGLDTTGTDHAPRFQAVEGAVDGAIVLDDPMEVAYERTDADLGGAGPAGRLLLRAVGASGGMPLAEHVLEGSWQVTLTGRVCQIRFGIAVVGDDETLTLTDTTSVFLENP